ncbi:hydratase [Veillonella sp. R32]|uniref:hydratase n=1 Tax=Veillonella sp. R32 TaxID=2021312 RepID=UPI00138A4731|nr:hydratase [Veillonella sp. R32]KAF1683431.1 hydratase [Veillonella sp. R32]
MVTLIPDGVFLQDGQHIIPATAAQAKENANVFDATKAYKETMAYRILMAHQTGDGDQSLQIKFDALTSHDITYVGIIQTAIASGLDHFPVPYVLTNCHNSLAAVGGTINEDDHVFGLSAVKRFGGIYVPPHLAVIHQYMREMAAGCGKMILGSDSHTRYGALGTMAIGEGGPELVKQLLGRTYDIQRPKVIAIYLEGKPRHGIGPQDVALAIEKAVFKNGFVKNTVMEFVGPGIQHLSMDFRNGIDVMTTETTCLSTIWCTDAVTKEFLTVHGRGSDFTPLTPGEVAYYDGLVKVELDKVESMIAMPFHPSNVYTIKELNEGGQDLLREIEAKAVEQLDNKELRLLLPEKYAHGKLHVDQGIIVGCSGGLYENVMAAANIVRGKGVGHDRFAFSVYPSSQPIYLELMRNGALADLMEAGAIVRTAFCGPCFGAGDTPNNGGLSARHATRNFPNREGSKPGNGQISSVALMDARSIAATAIYEGALTPATEVDYEDEIPAYHFNSKPYDHKVYAGFGEANKEANIIYGPSIKAWPTIQPLTEHILLKVAAYIDDPVTTTDELIPSGETSSFRSDPYALSEFALSRKVPEYVGRAKAVRAWEKSRQDNELASDLQDAYILLNDTLQLGQTVETLANTTAVASLVYANKPGDGSAREQAASCQRVLGGGANIALEYATKRYRSNVINWGMLPFVTSEEDAKKLAVGDYVYVANVRTILLSEQDDFKAYVVNEGKKEEINLHLGYLSEEEKEIIAKGCLINYYADAK